jgi:hypothetical protein
VNSEFYDQARRDAVAVCGFSNLQQLTPAQSVKVDLVLSLRLAIDELQSRLVAGVEKVDVNRLIGACDALVQLLPAGQENLTPPRSDDDDDALQKLEEILASIREANAFEEAREIDVLRAEVERITHENERLRAAAAQPAPAPAPQSQLLASSDPRRVVPLRSEGFRASEGRESWRPYVGSDGIHSSGMFYRNGAYGGGSPWPGSGPREW